MNIRRLPDAFRKPYIYLLLISILFTLIYIIELFVLQISERFSIWIGRLAAASFGSYLTVILVDLSIQRKEERERERVKRVALERLSRTINSQLELLANWYIGSLNSEPNSIPEDYTTFFDTDYIEQVKHLDFAKEYPTAGPTPNPTWFQLSGQKMKEFTEDIEDLIGKYGIFMDPQTLKTLQDISDSEITTLFHEDLIQMDRRTGTERDYNLLAGQNMDYYLAKHLALILEIVKWYEHDSDLQIKPVIELDAWKDDVTPHAGSAKLEKKLEEADPMFGMGPSYPVEEYD